MAFLVELGRGKPCEVVTQELFKKVISDENLKAKIIQYRSMKTIADEQEAAGNLDQAKQLRSEAAKLKSQLPGWVFQAKAMEEHEWIDSKKKSRGVAAWRHQDWARVNGMFMCDFDHIENPQKVFNDQIFPLTKKWDIKFAYITPSGKGLKVVMAANPSIGDISENQKAFANECGLELDEICFDASRLSFCTSHLDILFLDNSIFDYENNEFIEKYDRQYFKGVQQLDAFGGNDAFSPSASGSKSDNNGPSDGAGSGSPSVLAERKPENENYDDYNYCGISIDSIIEKLLDGKEVKSGKRHATLFDLAKILRYVCERSTKKVSFFVRKLQWVQDLDSEDHNVQRTIDDAMAKPYSSYMPKSLKNALSALGYDDTKQVKNNDMAPYALWGKQIRDLFPVYPCLKEVCQDVDIDSYPAALYVGAAFFGTLMTRCTYHFWFQPSEERRLNYAVLIIGHPGCGKSFAGYLYRTILDPIITKDKIGNDAINKYKEDEKRQSLSNKKLKDGELVYPNNIIRIHGPRTANGVFIEDMVKATEIVNGREMNLHLLTFSAELDSMTAANKGGQWIDKTNFELLAFHNEEDNQQYKNVDSVNGPFNVYWNFVYTGTYIALKKKVNSRNFGSGLFGRLGCIPMGGNLYECADERKLTKEDERRRDKLIEWAGILDKAQGELPLGPIVHSTHVFIQDTLKMAEIDDNPVDSFLSKRVPYYGINITAPFIFMRHYDDWKKKGTFKCDKTDIEFAKLVMDIQMHSQRKFFGGLAEKYIQESDSDGYQLSSVGRPKKSDDMFNQLTEFFSIQDVIKKFEMDENAARVMVSRWKSNGKVKKVVNKKGQNVWQKNE